MVLKFERFFSPAGENRGIHLYLPVDYYESQERYPVLYMFDGHNLFFDGDPPFGIPIPFEAGSFRSLPQIQMSRMGGVALIRVGLKQPLFLTDLSQALGNQYPRTVVIGIYLALAVFLPATGAIGKSLGTTGNGADAAGLAQYAVTAHPAVFMEDAHSLHLS